MSRGIRSVVAAFASLAVLVAGAAVWEYGRRSGTAAPDLSGIGLIGTLAYLGGIDWVRRRIQRDDLRWHRALALPGGARPGLLARRSKRGLALMIVAVGGIFAGGLLWGGARADGWNGRIMTALCVVTLPMLAWVVFKAVRHPILVAVTSQGVVAGGQTLSWEHIKSVRRDKDGVQLRVRDSDKGRWVTVGGDGCAVSNERLAHVIEYYRATPHRRIALDLNAPGPLGAVQ
ncbi:hypothetical protein ACTMTJ_02410 [Phytohabitans sp. LJ34]|uniref:hypothetical protein n=1 Tax=Phytohabitans sp. LJ34 TaxID=3452217 RepID=UPI003F8BF2CB